MKYILILLVTFSCASYQDQPFDKDGESQNQEKQYLRETRGSLIN